MEHYFYNLTSVEDVYESLNELYIQHGSKTIFTKCCWRSFKGFI